MNLKEEKGITLIALIITIIVMIIIAGIAIYSGKDTIKKANLESLKTNMLVIQAKTKTYVEEINFKLGPGEKNKENINDIRNEIYGGAKLKPMSEAINVNIDVPSSIPTGETVYWVTTEALENMGIGNITLSNGEAYFVEFDETNATVEVYNNKGYNGVYSLSGLDSIE